MIVFSSPNRVKNESQTVNQFFSLGMEFFHLRKKDWEEEGIIELIGEIHPIYRNRVILHDPRPFKYTVEGIGGVHAYDFEEDGFSASLKTLEDLNKDFNNRNHVFMSPVFTSISKKGYSKKWDYQELKLRIKNFHDINPKTKLIALGGITEKTAPIARELGFDDVAALGAIWQQPSEALNRFMQLWEV